MANYIKINKRALADGPGVRVSLYVSGCRNHCPGCHNPESWDFAKGTEITSATVDEILDLLAPDYIAGLTLCGGEPMEFENQTELAYIAALVKTIYPNKTIWCFTGYEFKDLLPGGKRHGPASDMMLNTATDILLHNTDVLITGRFILEQRDITKDNLWRGSKNQRVLDVKKSLEAGKAVALENIPNNIV